MFCFFPYKTGKTTLDQISKIYKKLIDQQRLIVPGRVAREFAKNRGGKISELFQQISRKSSNAGGLKNENYPLLDSLKEYKEMLSLEEEINKSLAKYRKSLSEILEKISQWQWNDPITKMYKELFSKGVVFNIELDRNEIQKDLIRRYEQKIPPGYKDAAKSDAGIGDLIIWYTILNLAQNKKKSVILVSGDEKADWQIRSEGQALCPRYELIDEFRRNSGGESFHILTFSNFLDLFGVSESVVAEVREKEMLFSEMEQSALSHLVFTIAIDSLHKFLIANYPEQVVSKLENADQGIDFEILYDDGSKMGVDAIITRRAPLNVLRSHIAKNSRLVQSGRYKNTIVAIVTHNDEESYRVTKFAERTHLNSYPGIALLIGYVLNDRFTTVHLSKY